MIAETLFDSGRWLYIGFLCHQAVKKAIKADWLELSADLWHDVDKVSLLIEPVLMSEEEDTMLYRDVMRTGIAA